MQICASMPNLLQLPAAGGICYSAPRFDGAGGYSDLVSASTTGDGGYGTALSDLLSHEVDVLNNNYVLQWRTTVTDGTMELCGLRVAYRTWVP